MNIYYIVVVGHVETVEKCLKPLFCLKNGAGKLVGKRPVFHRVVHTYRRLKGAANTISLSAMSFPAAQIAKPLDMNREKSWFSDGFPQFPQGMENFLWKMKTLRAKAFRFFVTICPRRFQHLGAKEPLTVFIR